MTKTPKWCDICFLRTPKKIKFCCRVYPNEMKFDGWENPEVVKF